MTSSSESISPVELRHWMHQNPELSQQEHRITRLLEQEIRKISDQLIILKPLPTGLVVIYPGQTGDYFLVRADMDALPMQGGVMHACGHDVHAAILYSTIQQIVCCKSSQSCIFLFQPAEERGGGAKQILDSGVLESYSISRAMSLHVTDEYPLGTVAVKSGSLFSASCEIDIEWQGKESHITRPDQGVNALQSLERFLQWIQSNPDPSVFMGVGRVQSGIIRNITPAQALLQGTIRAETAEQIDQFLNQIHHILETHQRLVGAGGATFQVKLGSRYSEVRVDQNLADDFINRVYSIVSVISSDLKRTAEDFGFFTQQYPSLMFWLGTQTANQSPVGLHHPEFNPDDSVLEIGAKIWLKLLE
jgi:N-acetyldiaminopimelate deacetylase